jgi:hypothetical protein
MLTMTSEVPTKTWRAIIEKVTLDELAKTVVYNIVYLFTLTMFGVLIATVYNYYSPIDLASNSEVLTVALLFAIYVLIDFGLLLSNKPTPALLAIVIAISPCIVIYRLLKSKDIVQIDRSVPTRLKRYIPFRFVNIIFKSI